MDHDEQFISGIHNYCDRWCERCEFTSRCRVFASEQEMSDEQRDVTSDVFVRNLRNIFAEVRESLTAKAEELGIEIEPLSAAACADIRAREQTIIKGDKVAKLADRYACDAGLLLEAPTEWLESSSDDDDMQNDVVEVLGWYQFFISAKIERAFLGVLDADGGEDIDEVTDPQSDANGSIKIALIAVERSILAWTYLLSPENTATVRPMIELLENIRLLAEQKFPNARDFVRPGFDEIETVM